MERKLNKLILVFVDIILINLAYLLALYIKFEGIVDTQLISYVPRYLDNAVYITIIKLGIFYYFNMYKTVWRYTSMTKLYNIVTAIILSNASVLSFLFLRQNDLSRTIYILTTLIDLSLIGGFRFGLRYFDRNIGMEAKKEGSMKRIMIIGAGQAGIRIVKECISNNQFDYEPVVIIDDDIKKQGEVIDEIPIVGGRQSILSAVDNYLIDEIIIAMPSAMKRDIREIVDICKEAKCKLRILPAIYESIDGDLSIKDIKEVDIGDLFRREGIRIDLDKISSYITGKVVMVTVGEGSMGLELCRQIGELKPKELILLDIYPYSPYGIEDQMRKTYPSLNFKVLSSSIIDRHRIDEIIKSEKPEVIVHASDHKDTFLLEFSPKEAINNNVFGTLNLVQSAKLYNVDKFIMISTDQVVNPGNIVDASRRICEMIIHSMNINLNTEYIVERANIVNSSDNIVPFPVEYRFLLKSLEELRRLLNEGKDEDVINYIKHMVPSYKEDHQIEKMDEDKYA